MEDNSGNQSGNASLNQPAQTAQTPPTSNVAQPPVQLGQATQPFSQQPPIDQQPAQVQASGGEKPKSGKKKKLLFFGGLIVFLVLFVVGLFAILIPTVNGLSACMEENSRSMDVLFQRGLQEKWTSQQKCMEFKPETEKLITCYESVGGKSLLPEQLAFTLGGLIRGKEFKVDKEGLIQLHNSNCSDYPEALIQN